MPSELGPLSPTIPWSPGAEYLQTKVVDVVGYTDDAVVYLDLQVYVTEEYPVVPFDLQVISVEYAEFVDSATIYLDLTNTGGECFSSSSGLTLNAEAWVRWFANATQRWEAEELVQFIAPTAFTQFLITEDDVEVRWRIIGISTDQGC